MTSPLSVTVEAARRFVRLATGLDAPFPDLQTALTHLGFVQIDPLNVCGRMHDLILRNRVVGYREGDLLNHVHQPSRPGFEHFIPGHGVLSVLPLDAWRYVSAFAQERRVQPRGYVGKLSAAEERLAQWILDEIRERGPLMSDDLDHDGITVSAWGRSGRASKTVLDKLFAHGRVLIAERRQFRRVYDLPERVLPSRVILQKAVSKDESARWIVLMRLRQRRLVLLKKAELALVEDCVQPLNVGDFPALYCLKEDLPLVEQALCISADERSKPLLLAPLDPVIYDRKLTERLWNFSYTWEVYTPAHKRVRGYYALPVLSGIEFVGHVEPRFDRKKNKLSLASKKVRRGHSPAVALQELGCFLGLRRTV